MKIITLHCDYIKFKPLKKALKSAELGKGEDKEKEIKEPLVVLTAFEEGDLAENIPKLIENIKDIARQVKSENIVLYPYAHLSSNLASPETAKELLEKAAALLKKEFNYKLNSGLINFINSKNDSVKFNAAYYESELRNLIK